MGKQSRKIKDKPEETRLLYKKSYNTIFAHSKTSSNISQYTSGILQMKRNLSQTKYYTEGDKIKRDLSIETDICIMRRYYRSKRSRMSYQESSAKSKYSTIIDSEIDTIDKMQQDVIASGDSESRLPTLDVTAVMLDNLKILLNKLMQKNLADNKDVSDKVDTDLRSILQGELKTERVSSDSTYVFNKDDREMKNKKIEAASFVCEYCKHKCHPGRVNSSNLIYKHLSRNTVPISLRTIKIISTLSVPRKKKRRAESWYRVKKIKQNNIILSKNNPSKIFNSSSFNSLALSKNNRKIKSLFKSGSNITATEDENKIVPVHNEYIKRNNLEQMPSLVKRIYADGQVNAIKSSYNIDAPVKTIKDISTLTNLHDLEHSVIDRSLNTSQTSINHNKYTTKPQTPILYRDKQSEPAKISFLDNSHELANTANQNNDRISHKHNGRSRINNYKKIKSYLKRKKLSSVYKLQNIESKHLKFYKKSGNRISNTKDALKLFRNLLNHFAEYKGNRDIKFDIQVKILPTSEGTVKTVKKDNFTNFSNVCINNYTDSFNQPINNKCKGELSTSEKEINNSPSKCNQKIIPILDSTISYSRYLNIESISKQTEQTRTADKDYTKSNSKIISEIHELKLVVKELSETTQKFLDEHIRKEMFKTESKRSENKCELENMSKGIQISNDFAKNTLQTGIKLSKEPKKDDLVFFSRLMKKSTSYNVIESESILKVTDMSVVNEVNDEKFLEQGLTCSLPKSRSLFAVTTKKNKRNVVAYFCDESCNKQSSNSRNKYTPPSNKCLVNKISSTESSEPVEYSSIECQCYPNNSSTVCIVNDEDECCDTKPFICTYQNSLSFREGFMYCIFLWIPVMIILSYILYYYVIKDLIHPKSQKLVRLRLNSDQEIDSRKSNNLSTIFDLKLSDLGF